MVIENDTSTVVETVSRVVMLAPDDMELIFDLHRDGWSMRGIAKKLGISRNTVTKYLKQGEWQPYGRPSRKKALERLEDWLRESFLQHNGNAAVVQQELVAQHEIEVSLRTVERAVAPFRKELKARRKATIRFETPPGKQLQIDFGSQMIEIGGVKRRIYLFVATLGYSRRIYVAPFKHERQSAWFSGLDGAFRHFGGVTEQVLTDNPRPLVTKHNPVTREVVFHERFVEFARYWRFQPKACAPYRPQTKGKDERAVGYVKSNAIAGRSFATWEQLEEHLVHWMREVADVRIHGTCKERPIERYDVEKSALKQIRPPFSRIRELRRMVQSDSCVEVDGNFYSVPWQHIGSSLVVHVADGKVIVFDRGEEIARHFESKGYRDREILKGHLSGVIRKCQKIEELPTSGFDRPLGVYQEFAGGVW